MPDEEVTTISRRAALKIASLGILGTTSQSLVITETAAQDDVQEWPQFQFDTRNTGYSTNVTGPATEVEERWSAFSTNSELTIHHSPVVANGVIYVGSEDHHIYAIDAESGSEVWSFDTGNPARGVVVSNDTVYAGSNGLDVLFALDAQDGSVKWKYTDPEGEGQLNRSPTVANGVVYGGGLDDYVFAVDASDGTELWRVFTNECFGGQVPTPAVVDGTVYIHEDCGRTWALDAANGSTLWRFSDGSESGQGSAPTVANGTVYFGTTASPDGTQVHGVFALEANTGSEQWRALPETGVSSSPAIQNESVYVGARDGNVYALDAGDGNIRWTFETDDRIDSSPAIVDGVLYIGSNDGNIYLLDTTNGEEIDAFSTGGAVGSSPAIADGSVYVGSKDGKLYALQEKPVEVLIDIKPGSDPNAINPKDRGVITVAVLHTSEFDPSNVNVSSLRFGAPPVVDQGGGAAPVHLDGHLEDINGDGNDDLVLHFPTQDTGFEEDNSKGKLVGETTIGRQIIGTDTVDIVVQGGGTS